MWGVGWGGGGLLTLHKEREREREREEIFTARTFSPRPLPQNNSHAHATHTPAPARHTKHPLQAQFFATAVSIAKSHKAECDKKGLKKIVEFRASLRDDDAGTWPAQLKALKAQVLEFARSFPVVGFDAKTAKY